MHRSPSNPRHLVAGSPQPSHCINAKAETVDKLPTFRVVFKKRRCVAPTDGFYEWRGPKGKREPLWLHPAAGGLILFAGL